MICSFYWVMENLKHSDFVEPSGMAEYIPVIRRLISEELDDQFPPDELQELLRDIFD